MKTVQLIQVCSDLSEPATRKREMSSLLKASRELGCGNLLVITNDKEGAERVHGKKMVYAPLWKWLLS